MKANATLPRQVLFVLLLLASTACIQKSAGQINYAGKDFWLSLPNTGLLPEGDIKIASKHTAQVQLEFTNTGQTQLYTVAADSVLTFRLPGLLVREYTSQLWEQVEKRSLHITADSDVVVYTNLVAYKADDGITVLPSDNQRPAETYYLISAPETYAEDFELPYFGYSIVSPCDSVQLEITPSRNTYAHAAGIPFAVTLNRGESYMISPRGENHQTLDGTIIRVQYNGCCRRPVNIFKRFAGTYYPAGACCSDELMEQLLPADWWDTTYPVASWGRNPVSPLRILSAANNNVVYIDNQPVKTLSQGAYFDTVVYAGDAIVIRGTYPLGILQGMYSEGYPPGYVGKGDPESLWAMSPQQGIRESLFSIGGDMCGNAPNDPSYFMLTVISRTRNIPSIRLNGVGVAGFFHSFRANPDWQCAIIPILNSTVYHFESDERAIAYAYVICAQGGWSYNLSEVNVDDTLKAESGTYHSYTDTVSKCPGAGVRLAARNAAGYLWSTGETAAQITVTAPGRYWVRERYNARCGDSMVLHRFHVLDSIKTLPADTVSETQYLCAGHSLHITAMPAERYLWSTGDTTREITVTDTGRYYVWQYLAHDSCTRYKYLRIITVAPANLQVITRRYDTLVCMGQTATLRSTIPSLLWSDGQQGDSIIVDEPGVYTARGRDSCGRHILDSFRVDLQPCGHFRYCDIWFPNAFTPNGDGKNDTYRPVVYGGKFLEHFYYAIYDRWGELVFETYDPAQGWDGLRSGVPAPVGTYMYGGQVKCRMRKTDVIRGDLTLIR